jgi:hypothetical protein
LAENVVYVFDSEAALKMWGKATQPADQFAKISAALAAGKRQPHSKGGSNVNHVQSVGGSATLYDGYTQTGTPFYRAVTGLAPTLGSFDNRASSIQVFNPVGYSTMTACALYSSTYYTGIQLIVWNNLPNSVFRLNDLRVFGWNNVASSFIVL